METTETVSPDNNKVTTPTTPEQHPISLAYKELILLAEKKANQHKTMAGQMGMMSSASAPDSHLNYIEKKHKHQEMARIQAEVVEALEAMHRDALCDIKSDS